MARSCRYEYSLPPAPHFFYINVMDSNSEGLLAYGSRSSVVIMDITTQHPVMYDMFSASENYVTCVSFCKYKKPWLLAVSCDSHTNDSSLKIWDIQSEPKVLNECGTLKACSALEWQTNTDNVLFFSAERGCIVEWDLTADRKRAIKLFQKKDILALASGVFDSNILAAGHKGGTISVVDVSKGKCIYKLVSHSTDCSSLSWSPNNADELLSSGYDNSICIWLVSEEHVKKTLYPARRTTKKHGYQRNDKSYVLATWHPTSSNCIISSSVQGEVGIWNLDCESDPNFKPINNKETAGHNRAVLNLVMNNFNKNIVITFSFDRQIRFWDVSSFECVSTVPTLCGFAYNLEFAPLDIGKLAVAVGDGNIRIWDIQNVSSPYSVKILWRDIKGKVMKVIWHPQKESVLAFGTDEGQVGVIDSLHTSRKVIFPFHSHGSIYSLSWGPCSRLTESENDGDFGSLCLFALVSGKLLIYSLQNPTDEPLNFDDIIESKTDSLARAKPKRSEVSWKPDFSLLAVGNDDGYVEIYNDSFVLLTSLQAQKKLINCLRWHPRFTALSSSDSSMHAWLGVASCESVVHVYDLMDIMSSSNVETTIISESTRQLVGHSNRVFSLCWSPHSDEQMASASYDGKVMIWNVQLGQMLVSFNDHNSHVFCVQWHVIYPDIIFSGGEDYRVLQWKISAQCSNSSKRNVSEKKYRKKNSKKNKKSMQLYKTTASEKTVIENTEEEEEQKNDKVSAVETEPSIEHKDLPEDNVPVTKKKKKRTLFPFHRSKTLESKNILQDCLDLADIFLENSHKSVPSFSSGETSVHLGIFGDKSALLEMLNTEIECHHENGYTDSAFTLEVWKGNIGTAIKDAAEKGQLTAHHVAVASLGSRSLWLEACEKFALQLTKRKYFHEAALYLLACHKVHEAINLLKDHVSPRDALVLAKFRLPENDPLLQELILSWIQECKQTSRFELEALCHIALGHPVTAAASLCKKPIAVNAQAAAHICLKYGYLEDAKHYSLLCIKQALFERNWEVAKSMIEEQPSMKCLGILIFVHETLCTHVDSVNSESQFYGVQENVFSVNNGLKDLLLWKPYNVNSQSWLNYLYKYCQETFQLSKDLASQAIELISMFMKGQQQIKTLKEAVFKMTLYITADILTFFTEENNTGSHCILLSINNCLSACVDVNDLKLLNAVSSLLFPFDLFWSSNNEIFLSKLSSSCDSCTIVDQAYSELQAALLNQKILLPAVSLNERSLICNNGDLWNDIQDIFKNAEEKLCNINVVDAIFAFFSLNFVEQLSRLISEKNLQLRCHNKQILKSEEQQEIKSLPELSQDINELNSPENDNMNELMLLLEEKEKMLKNLSDSVENTQDNDNTSTLASVQNIAETDCKNKISEGGSKKSELISSDINGIPTIKDVNILNGDIHQQCMCSIDIYLNVINVMSLCLCSDLNAIKQFLISKLKSVDNSLMLNAASHCDVTFSDVKLPVETAQESCDASSSENEKGSKIFSDMVNGNKADSPCELDNKIINEVVNGNSALSDNSCENADKLEDQASDSKSEISELSSSPCIKVADSDDKRQPDQNSELKCRRQDVLGALNFLKEIEQVENFPNSLSSAENIISLHGLVANRCECPVMKKELNKCTSEIENWAKKFKLME